MTPLICICCGEPIGHMVDVERENPNMCAACLATAGDGLQFDPPAPLFREPGRPFEVEAGFRSIDQTETAAATG
jgi:hypothetical protein